MTYLYLVTNFDAEYEEEKYYWSQTKATAQEAYRLLRVNNQRCTLDRYAVKPDVLKLPKKALMVRMLNDEAWAEGTTQLKSHTPRGWEGDQEPDWDEGH